MRSYCNKVDPYSNMTGILPERGNLGTESCTQEKRHVNTGVMLSQVKELFTQSEERGLGHMLASPSAFKGTMALWTLTLDCQPQNYEAMKLNHCCLSHLAWYIHFGLPSKLMRWNSA